MGEQSSSLMDFVASMGGERKLRVEENLGAGFVRLRVAEAERRQAKHDIRCVEDAVVELLRNARDAGAAHIFVASTRTGDLRTITVLDDGEGIPKELHERIFDARVTSKLDTMHVDRWGIHGRGMALYSIRENAESASVVTSAPGKGSSLQVSFDVSELTERADQSTWPSIAKDEDGQLRVSSGPHNILRTCCEFALEEHDSCSVYVGSPAEMVATARRRVRSGLDEGMTILVDNMEKLGVVERLVLAAGARELTQAASSVGLEMSERTAHRIIAGDIAPAQSVYNRLVGSERPRRRGEVDLLRDRRAIKVTADDRAAFSRIMERDFSYLADRYYLELSSDPVVRVANGKVTVTFDVVEPD